MSEYGPAIFCARPDGAEISDEEQGELGTLVAAICAELSIVDDMEGRPVQPWKYDYDGYETRAISFVLWSNYGFGGAPDYIQEDFHADAKGLSKRIAVGEGGEGRGGSNIVYRHAPTVNVKLRHCACRRRDSAGTGRLCLHPERPDAIIGLIRTRLGVSDEENQMKLHCAAAVFTMIVGLTLSALPVAAQPAPRTPWGQPDLQGIWDFRTITPIERPEELGDKEFWTAEEVASQEQEALDRDRELWEAEARRTEAGGNVGAYNNFWMDRGTKPVETRRTSLIIDPPNGRLPELSAVGQRRTDARREYQEAHSADSYVTRNSSDRCIVGFNAGPPITPLAYNQNMQLFQTPDHVVIYTEMVHTPRFVPLDGRPTLDDGIGLWSGDSRGRWEGDTLVVETANFGEQRKWIPLATGRPGLVSTANMTLVERFTRVDEDTLDYTFTVTDPDTWASPWTMTMPMRRTDMPLFEYACHEGNYSMEGILSGARADDRAAAEGSR